MSLLLILNVVYVLLAIAMIALILMQRGAGAQAGSGFGGGASATVFGSRGASNFLTKSTKYLAILFFVISLFMAWYHTRGTTDANPAQQDLGVMAQLPGTPATAPNPTIPSAPRAIAPAPPGSTVPQAPANASPAPTQAPQNTLQPQPVPQPQPAPPQGG